MRRLFLLIALPFILAGASEIEMPPQSSEVMIGDWSPSRNYYIEHHQLAPNEVNQVWIVSAKSPSERKLIYTHGRSIRILFSGDEKHLAITDYAGSDISTVLIFEQQKGADYKQVCDIGPNAWKFLADKSGRTQAPLNLDHDYVEALRWTDDQTILINIHGHGDSNNHVDNWICLYDIKTNKFSTDFDLHNKRHTMLSHGKS